jgi:hypothetical protein
METTAAHKKKTHTKNSNLNCVYILVSLFYDFYFISCYSGIPKKKVNSFLEFDKESTLFDYLLLKIHAAISFFEKKIWWNLHTYLFMSRHLEINKLHHNTFDSILS